MSGVAAIVLAAGRGTRFGAEPKLLAVLDGKPLVRHVAETALASMASPVLAVVGHRADEVMTTLAGLMVIRVDNPAYADGLSSSLKAGFAELPPESEAAVVLLGDMPRVTPALIDQLVEAFGPETGALAVVPVRDGHRGNPVLVSRPLFAEVRKLTGDVGARGLLGTYGEGVVELPVSDDAAFLDVDTPEALQAVRAG